MATQTVLTDAAGPFFHYSKTQKILCQPWFPLHKWEGSWQPGPGTEGWPIYGLERCLQANQGLATELWEFATETDVDAAVREGLELSFCQPPTRTYDCLLARYRHLRHAGFAVIWLVADPDEPTSLRRQAAAEVGLLMIEVSPQRSVDALCAACEQIENSGDWDWTAIWREFANEHGPFHPGDATPGIKEEYARLIEASAWSSLPGYETSCAGEPSPAEVRKLTWTELLEAMLQCIEDGDDDAFAEHKADAIGRFRKQGPDVDAALFDQHRKQQTQTLQPRAVSASLDMSRISGLNYLLDGFVPDQDLTLIWGAAGAGKTTAALAMAKAVLEGTGFLDHTSPSSSGGVLFIASDSGAAPLQGAMQDLGMSSMPETMEGPQKRFHVWAADSDQGMSSWSADLAGCIRLLDFVKANGIKLVLIDSCKAVCSGGGIDYTNNRGVTSLLTYFKEVICPHTAVVFLNHDGAERGQTAGAKTWKEIPSAVHQISIGEDKNSSSNLGIRQWRVTKNRLGSYREVFYQLRDGILQLCSGTEKISNCMDRVIKILSDAFKLQGEETLSKRDLAERICRHGGPSRKSLDNSLTTETRSKHPRIVRRGHGRYALAPRLLDDLKSVNKKWEVFAEKAVIERDLDGSLQVPMGTSQEMEGKFPRESDGNIEDLSHGDGSDHVPSQNGVTHYEQISVLGSDLVELRRIPRNSEDDAHWPPRNN